MAFFRRMIQNFLHREFEAQLAFIIDLTDGHAKATQEFQRMAEKLEVYLAAQTAAVQELSAVVQSSVVAIQASRPVSDAEAATLESNTAAIHAAIAALQAALQPPVETPPA